MKANMDVSAAMETVKQQYLEQQLMSDGISSILRKYSTLKDGCEYEADLPQISNSRLRKILTNFRLGNHRLQCQLVKWVKDPAQIDEVRPCKACGWPEEDEEHMLLHYQQYMRFRDISTISRSSLKDLSTHGNQLNIYYGKICSCMSSST